MTDVAKPPAIFATASTVASGEGRRVPTTGVGRRMIENLRVLLAIIAQLLMLDVGQASRPALSLLVIAYSLYAVVLLWSTMRGSRLAEGRIFCWLDALFFLLMVGFAGDAKTRYFLLLFFPVIFAAWRVGHRESMAVAAVSGLAAMGLFWATEPVISLPRLLALPLSLLFIGPIFVKLAWGDTAARKIQQLASSVAENLDPSRGFDTVVTDMLARIGEESGASSVIFSLRTVNGASRTVRWTPDGGVAEPSGPEALSMADCAMRLPADISLAWKGDRRWWEPDTLLAVSASGALVTPAKTVREALIAAAGVDEHCPLLSVPLSRPGIGQMRIAIAGSSIEHDPIALEAFGHAFQRIGALLENAYLREQLADEAAETERARIGRDLHDSAIQPYIGLKFGLEAVLRRAGPDNPITPDLARLLEATSGELHTMREVVSGLRGLPGEGGAVLSKAIRRQAERFGQLFGMQVEVRIGEEAPITRRLAGELFHMVAEGLSNIRRHTRSRKAAVTLASAGDVLVLSIRNEHNGDATPAARSFTPLSLTERAASLGGSVEVSSDAVGTEVQVRVPMVTRKPTRNDDK